jgi:hypothetical protein
MIIVVVRGLGRAGLLLRIPIVVETNCDPSNFPLRPLGFIAGFLNLMFIIGNVVFLMPVCRDFIGLLCDDTPIDHKKLFLDCMVYGGLSAVAGLCRTIHRLSRLTTHWTESHLVIHTFISFGIMAFIVLQMFERYGFSEFSVIIEFSMLSWSIGGVILCLGVFFSYGWSFLTVVFALAQRKSG